MRKRGLRRLAAVCLLLSLLILEGLGGRSPLFNNRDPLDLGATQSGASPTAISLTQREMNALVQYKAWLRSQADVRSGPAASPGADPSASAARRQCAQAIDATYPLLPLPGGQLAPVIPGSIITSTAATHSQVDDPCLLYLAHELLFGNRPGSLHHPGAASGSTDPQATRQPVPSRASPGAQQD